MIENGGAILVAHVGTLAVGGGGVMSGEKDFQESLVGDGLGIKLDTQAFGGAGCAGGDVLIGRVGCLGIGVAGGNGGDALEVLKYGFGAPETAGGESGSGHSFFWGVISRVAYTKIILETGV